MTRARRVGMHLCGRAVHVQLAKGCRFLLDYLADNLLEHPRPGAVALNASQSAALPAGEPVETGLIGSVTFGHVPPRRPSPNYPTNPVEDRAMALVGPTPFATALGGRSGASRSHSMSVR